MPKNKYHLTIFGGRTNSHWQCFQEMHNLVFWSLMDLGCDVSVQRNHIDTERVNIIFGWHEFHGPEHPVSVIRDNQCILFQGEQITQGGRPLPDWYFQSLIDSAATWDYSADHIQILKHNNVRAFHVPPSWHQRAKTITSLEEKESDVLFCGAKNLRRDYITKAIGVLCRVKVLADTYGAERDDAMAKTHLVLNVHYYPSQTLELLRISHALSNEIPVVSEISETNPYGDGIAMVSYRKLPAVVLALLSDKEKRTELARRGHETIQESLMVDVVRSALIESGFEAEDSVALVS